MRKLFCFKKKPILKGHCLNYNCYYITIGIINDPNLIKKNNILSEISYIRKRINIFFFILNIKKLTNLFIFTYFFFYHGKVSWEAIYKRNFMLKVWSAKYEIVDVNCTLW